MATKYAKVMISDDGGGKWEGSPLAEVSRDWLQNLGIPDPQVGDVFWIGPFPVRIVDLNPRNSQFGYVVIVERQERGIHDEIYLVWHKLTMFLELINIRCLKTAKIWNFLDVEEGMRPYWGDLRVLKAFRRKKK